MSGHLSRLFACEGCGAAFLYLHAPYCRSCGGRVLLTTFKVFTGEIPGSFVPLEDVVNEGDEIARECGELLDCAERKVRGAG